MSRIGRQPVPLPDGVSATPSNGGIVIRGPLGQVEQRVDPRLRVVVDEAKRAVRIERTSDDREVRALHGMTRNLIANMVVGVTKGYAKAIQVVGVGYSAKLQGQELILQVGYHNDVHVPIPEGLTVDPP